MLKIKENPEVLGFRVLGRASLRTGVAFRELSTRADTSGNLEKLFLFTHGLQVGGNRDAVCKVA